MGQIQYLQPFLSILAAWILLSESITIGAIVAAIIVVLAVAKGRSATVRVAKS
ncbi:Uncharacterised protein [Mycobacterium tuberculosis]|nr:Uncharacterised protein [Mycobacterium tuberculosis]